MDGQVFRIEIPVEAQDKTDLGQFEKLEKSIENIIQKVGLMAQKLDGLSGKQEDAFEGGARGASNFGQSVGGAQQKTDRFTQSMEKTAQQLEKLTRSRHEIALELKDRALTAVRNTYNTAKALTSKALYVTMRLKDFVTAPLRKAWSLIANPVTMAATTLGIGMGASDMLSTFNGFETGMSNVQALTQATAEDFASLRAQALDLGATTKFTAAEAAEGMSYLGMAGWEASEIIKAMPGLLSLAAAGNTDLATASDIVSDVMTAMGMSADRATEAADVFALATAKSNTTIEGMGEAMKYAAPIAHSYNMSLQETAGTLGLMANAGIKGSQAGTAMRSALLRLADPAKEARDWMKRLDLSFTKSNGSMKDIVTIVRDTEKSFAGLTKQERLAAAQSIFGVEASSAWLGVLDQGSDVLEQFIHQLENSTGAAQEMSEIQLDNLAGDITLLQSAMDGMKVTLMDELNPYARQFIQTLTGMVPGATTAIVNFVQSAIEKAGELKTKFDEMTSSDEWQNADFAGKLTIAWDEIIIDPFNTWWQSGGQEQVTQIASQIGGTMGATLSGVIVGGLALLSGEEVTGEGLNLTPLAAAAFDAGAAFTKSFAEAFDANEIVKKIPEAIAAIATDAMKLLPGGEDPTGTSWLSAILVGTGTANVIKFFGDLGINVGTVADGLALCKAGIEMITTLPGPVVAAGLVVGGVAAAVGLYNAAMETYEQNLLGFGDRINEAVESLDAAYERADSVQALIDERNELTMQLDIATNYTPEQVAQARSDLDELDKKASNINTALQNLAAGYDLGNIRNAETIITEIGSIDTTIKTLQGKRTSLEKDLALGKIDKTDFDTQAGEIDEKIKTLNEQRDALKEQFAVGGLDYSTFMQSYTVLKSELKALETERDELMKIITFSGLSEDEKTAIIKRIGEIDAALINMSDGLITKYDLENGAMESKLGLLEEQLRIEREIAALRLQETIMQGEETAPETYKLVQSKYAEIEGVQAESSELNQFNLEMAQAKINALELQAQWTALEQEEIAGWNPEQFDYQKGFVSKSAWQDDLWSRKDAWEAAASEFEYSYDAMNPTMHKFDITGNGVSPGVLKEGLAVESDGTGIIDVAYAQIAEKYGDYASQLETLYGDAAKGEQSLQDLYNSHVKLIELNDLEGQSIQYMAANYATLTDEQKTSFAQAAEELRALNEEYEYIPDEKKISVTGLWGTAYQNAESALQQSRNYAATMPDYMAYEEELMGKYEEYTGVNTQYENAMNLISAYEEAIKLGDEVSAQDYAKQIVDGSINANGEKMLSENYIDDDGLLIDEGITAYKTGLEKMLTEAGAAWDTYVQEGAANLNVLKADLQAGGVFYEQLLTKARTYQQAIADVTGIQEWMSTKQAAGTWTDDDVENQLAYYKELQELYAIGGIELPDITQLSELGTVLEGLGTGEQGVRAEAETLAENMASLLSTIENLESFSQLGISAAEAAEALNSQATMGDQAFQGYKRSADAISTAIAAWPEYKRTIHEIITVKTQAKSGSLEDVDIPERANGGILSGPELAWVAEDGPEAIIPLGSKRRDRGLDLWYQAGRMLDVPGFADGAIVDPFSGIDLNTADIDWDDYDDDVPASVPSSDGRFASVDVNAPITIKIDVAESNDPQAVVRAIVANKTEISDVLAKTLSDALNEIYENR